MDIYERLGLPRPSFWEGVARTLDIGGVFSAPRKRSMPAAKTDGEILASDWEAVGADMWAAIEQFAAQEGSPFKRETERREVSAENNTPETPEGSDNLGGSLTDILAPVHAYSRQMGYTEDEIDVFVDEQVAAYKAERRALIRKRNRRNGFEAE